MCVWCVCVCVCVCMYIGAARADVAGPAGEDRRVERDGVGKEGLTVSKET